jgi:hypothetical protein
MSHEKKPTHSSPAPRAGWNQPRPEKLPEPTAWPAGAALGQFLHCLGRGSGAVCDGDGGMDKRDSS